MAEERIDNLKRKNKSLKAQNATWQRRCVELFEQKEKLEKENEKLKSANGVLRKRQQENEDEHKNAYQLQETLLFTNRELKMTQKHLLDKTRKEEHLNALNQMLLVKVSNADRYAKMQDRQVERMSELSVALHGQAHATHQKLELYQLLFKTMCDSDPYVKEKLHEALKAIDARIE